jgi:hypothetical protein
LPELTIGDRKVTVGADVAAAFDLIQGAYAGRIVQDNGQAEGPFVAFGFPSTPAQVGLRLNKHKLTVYARERMPDGQLLSDAVPGLVVEARYDSTTGSPVHSIKNGLVPYLRLADAAVVRAEVTPDKLRAVLDACLGKVAPFSSSVPPIEAAAPPMAEDPGKTPRARRPMTPEDLLSQLDRRSELGRQGEEVAARHERARLHTLGCAAPDDHVEHVAL